ncbi:DUF1269 domain-containing protein [Enhydrobacter sp.]|jgi:uncharacterized membrane protein|uniref:DUF1269 domain-containing protein n=1 Tax=Enhydrobacter sp. TaxID=1894999 RepID=UPI002629BD52|nr:DUF1269 domain-containing protein [Enhydrobacter sp.]
MSRFVVAIFPDLPSAQGGIRALKDLASEDVIRLHGAATVTKGDRGKLTMRVMADDGPAITAAGALLGGLAGLAIGPLAVAILAAGGAVSGAAAGITHRAAGEAFAEQVAQDLPADSAAVVAEVTTEDVAILVARLEAVGGTVTRQDTLPAK